MVLLIFLFLHLIYIQNSLAVTTYTSFQTEIVCNSAYAIRHPSSMEEVRQIVLEAIATNSTVKAIGSLHSFSYIICTEGIPIQMHGINHMEFDLVTNMVKVGAGVRVGQLIEYLKKRDRALNAQFPSFKGVTIGGALGSGAKGATLIHHVSISDLVVNLTVIDGLGAVRVIDKSEDLDAWRVSLGLLGIVLEATFPTVPAYKMEIRHYRDSECVLFNGFPLQMAQNFDWFQIWWYPNSESVVVSEGKYVGQEVPGNATNYQMAELQPRDVNIINFVLEYSQKRKSKVLLKVLEFWSQRSLYRKIPLRAPLYSDDGGKSMKNPATGYVHDLMSSGCEHGKCPWDYGSHPQASAFSSPLEELEAVVLNIKSILRKYPLFLPIIGILFKFGKASTGLMSNEFGRETLIIEVVSFMRKYPYKDARFGLAAFQAIEQALVFEHNGRPAWGISGQAFQSQEILKRSTPNLKKFRQYMTKYDPKGIFQNKFGKRLTGETNEFTINPHERHCALLGSCFCARDTDCASTQKCATFKNFHVCEEDMLDVE